MAAVCAAVALSMRGAAPHVSALWGERGEKWRPDSRLPDFSWAGYHSGVDPLPGVPETGALNVRDFGTVGDGEHDDSAAFLKALDTVKQGVVLVPPGRYRITQILEIKKSGVVMRGAGPDRTTLYFPIPLTEIRPDWGATTSGERTSNYSWSGGFVWLRGSTGNRALTDIAAPARRGDTRIAVAAADGLKVGQQVRIEVRDDPERTLAAHLYSEDPGNTAKMRGTRAGMTTRIRAIERNTVTLDRALRFDLRAAWQPKLMAFEPTVTESGVENLRFEFPLGVYKGHFTELGFNPLAFTGTAHCWARNLRIVNAESGPFVTGTFNTISGLVYESARTPWRIDRQGHMAYGHHGVYLGGDDNLFTDFDLRTTFVHDLSVSRCGGNVFADGKGMDLDFDHHKDGPYENLFTNIDAGAGTRLWACGGGDALGRHCGARGTFWNIRAGTPLTPPPAGWGPASMNFVGLFTTVPSRMAMDGEWWESSGEVAPRNLYRAQVAARLGRK